MQTRRFKSGDVQRIFDRYEAGETVTSIAHSLGRYQSTIRQLVMRTGGVRPPVRTRSDRHLSFAEREEISRGLCAGESYRLIATRLGRSPSTISREVGRNRGPAGYRAHAADQMTSRRARRPKPGKLAECRRLRLVVEAKLEKKWSPQQIAEWLPRMYPSDPEMRVSHETIYISLFVQGRGALRKELHRALRSGRAHRRPKKQLPSGQGKLANMTLISERPVDVDDRAVPGHWEGDLIMGTKNSAIGTLVERSTRFVMLFKVSAPTAEEARRGITKKIRRLPAELRRTLTWDQGSEMAQHVQFTVDTGVQVYFCDPSSPWQRGTNENTNGLLRQYFPKSTDISLHTQARLNTVARELNARPRQTLGWMTPSEKLAEAVASTN